MTDEITIKCSFCEKTKDDVKKIIAGHDVYICDECIEVCHQIILEDVVPSIKIDGSIPSPKIIKEFLDMYVIGQDCAKTVLSVAVNNHYKRLENPVIDEVEIQKSNVLFLGPTGCGKTLLAQTIARMLDVPFAMADATSLTEAGYVGDDVENIIVKLLQVADGDIEKAQRGIIYIDEIDKLARRGDSASITRDVGGEGVQQAILKVVEGSICRVPPEGGRKHPSQDMIEIDTTNILFILGGAFVGLENIVEQRSSSGASIGFGAEVKVKSDSQTDLSHLLDDVEPRDLHKFGMIPEFVGRVPVRAPLKELTEEQLVKVLSEPKNAITRQFEKLFMLEKVELEFNDESLISIAKMCIKDRTGARGLRSIFEKSLLQIQFDLPELAAKGLKKIVVTNEFISGETDSPIMVYETAEQEQPAS